MDSIPEGSAQVVRRTIAEVTLVDRRSQKAIWKTTKSGAFDRNILADDIMLQLKQDWRKSASAHGGLPTAPSVKIFQPLVRNQRVEGLEVLPLGLEV